MAIIHTIAEAGDELGLLLKVQDPADLSAGFISVAYEAADQQVSVTTYAGDQAPYRAGTARWVRGAGQCYSCLRRRRPAVGLCDL
jgi:hypothetical protein